jgi:hypothetical protein
MFVYIYRVGMEGSFSKFVCLGAERCGEETKLWVRCFDNGGWVVVEGERMVKLDDLRPGLVFERKKKLGRSYRFIKWSGLMRLACFISHKTQTTESTGTS